MPVIKSFTIFNPNPFGHGAERRTAQLVEILDSEGFKWSKLTTGEDNNNWSLPYLNKFLKLLLLNLKLLLILRIFPSLKRILKNTWLYSHFEGILEISKKKIPQVVLWEVSKMEFSFIVPYFKKRGAKIIAIPHNLESLVPGQKSGLTNRLTPRWFMEEIRILSKCDKVFTISKEETLLLRQFHIDANYLPYFPCNQTYKYLLNIRKERQNSAQNDIVKKQILMLGSAINPPTKKGMIDRIDFFSKITNTAYEILIAGFGVDTLIDNALSEDCPVRILGQISDEYLSELFIKIDAVLIHQEPSSGALTRIPECLVAGIPVIADFNSSRNYFGIDGLYTYYSDEQMITSILTEKAIPKIPIKPVFEYTQFLNTLKSLNDKK